MVVAMAKPPPLRDQILLNGIWPIGGEVPVYAGEPGFDRRVYERDVEVPAEWAGRVLKLEFGAVNFGATIWIDGVEVAQHIGGWCPFAVDITRNARRGGFHLKVEVRGPGHPPVTDGNGRIVWPVGGWHDRGGIADDVWLRAYGKVRIADAFIRSSVQEQTLSVDYTLCNEAGSERVIRIHGAARREERGPGQSELDFESGEIKLLPGETRLVTVTEEWRNPALYWPDDPVLYDLVSEVREGGTIVDRETRRFGFREITIRGGQFLWNGVRINLFGDYETFGDNWYVDSAHLYSPGAWSATARRIKAMNIRVLRWHHNPVPQYLLDVCDEQGLLVCDEAANYARDFMRYCDHETYLRNAVGVIEPWIRADRNHPSIYLWNATNEMTHSFCGPFDPAELAALGAEIRRCDPTRPVGYDGDSGRPNAALFVHPDRETLLKGRVTDSALVDYHYPEGYNHEPAGSIYSWAHLVFPDRPTGAGELLHTRSPDPDLQEAMERNTWWLGVWLRGLRYTNWTNVKPACWWFTDGDLASNDPAVRRRTLNLRNALAPVAAFDREYDDLGISPFVTGAKPGGRLPELQAGAKAERTFVVYNDEFSDRALELEIEWRDGSVVIDSVRQSLEVGLGMHREVRCRFDVPHCRSETLTLVRRVFKGGVLRFEEGSNFRVSADSSVRVVRPDARVIVD